MLRRRYSLIDGIDVAGGYGSPGCFFWGSRDDVDRLCALSVEPGKQDKTHLARTIDIFSFEPPSSPCLHPDG